MLSELYRFNEDDEKIKAMLSRKSRFAELAGKNESLSKISTTLIGSASKSAQIISQNVYSKTSPIKKTPKK